MERADAAALDAPARLRAEERPRPEGLRRAGDVTTARSRRPTRPPPPRRPRGASLDLARQRLADAVLRSPGRRRRGRAPHRRRRAARARAPSPSSSSRRRRSSCASACPSATSARAQPGQAVRATVDPYPGQAFDGKVERRGRHRSTRRRAPSWSRPSSRTATAACARACSPGSRSASAAGRELSDDAEARRDLRPAPGLRAGCSILSLVVVGVFAYGRLGVDRFPKIDLPFVTDRARVLVGAAPEEIETEVTDKIEEAVNTISGIDQLISISSEGVSLVIITFELEKNADVAAQEVRDRVNSVLRDLPRDAEPPVIEKIDPDAAPVLSIALSGDGADPRRHRVRGQGAAPPARVGARRRPGAAHRRAPAPDQRGRRPDAAVGARASPRPRSSRRSRLAERPAPRRPRRAGAARPDAAHLRPRRRRPRRSATSWSRTARAYRVRVSRRRAASRTASRRRRPWPASTASRRSCSRSASSRAPTRSQVVERAARARSSRLAAAAAEGLPACDVVRDQSEYIVAAVDTVQEHLVLGSLLRGRRSCGCSCAASGRPSSPRSRSRARSIATFAAMQLHGLHAQHHHAPGAHPGGRHRHRRRGDRAREHLPLHGGEEAARRCRRRSRARARSASPCSRPRCR